MPSSALCAVGVLAWGCVVYDSDLLSNDAGLSGSGNTAADGGRSGMSTGGGGAGSKPGTAGSKNTDGGTFTAGSAAVEGGAPSEDGGTGGDAPLGGSAGAGGAGGTPGGSAGSGGGGKAGSGGTGGNPPTVKCSDHPLTPKAMWVGSASISSLGNGMESDGLYNPPSHLTDGLLNERWSSGVPQAGDEWIQIDFVSEVTLTRITLQLGSNPNDWPRGYAIRVSNTDQDFNAPALASGVGAMATDVVVNLPEPATGRYLLVRQTGVVTPPAMSWWTIAEVLVTCID